jgi:hypothetical protein
LNPPEAEVACSTGVSRTVTVELFTIQFYPTGVYSRITTDASGTTVLLCPAVKRSGCEAHAVPPL